MGEAIGALLWMILEVALVLTGKVVVAVASFGRWRGERLSSTESRIYGPAGALSFKRDGQRVVTANGLLFVGVLFYVLLSFILLWWASYP